MKTCPNCNTQNPDGASFCRGCGASLQSAAQSAAQPVEQPMMQTVPTAPVAPSAPAMQQPAPLPRSAAMPQGAPATPVAPSAAKKDNKFGRWLLSALKTPSRAVDTEPWFGFVITGVTALLMSLTILAIVQKTVSAFYDSPLRYFTGFMSGMSGSSYGSSSSSDLMSSVFFKSFLLSALVVYILIAVVFLGSLIFGAKESFLAVHDRFARYLVALDIAFLVALLLAFAGASVFAAVMFFALFGVMEFLVVLDVARMRSTRNADIYWLVLAVVAVLFVALTLFMWIASSVFIG